MPLCAGEWDWELDITMAESGNLFRLESFLAQGSLYNEVTISLFPELLAQAGKGFEGQDSFPIRSLRALVGSQSQPFFDSLELWRSPCRPSPCIMVGGYPGRCHGLCPGLLMIYGILCSRIKMNK